MSGNQLSTAPLPNAISYRFHELSHTWRRKVALALLLSLFGLILKHLSNGIVIMLDVGLTGKIIYLVRYWVAMPLGIVSIWLVTTPLPESFRCFCRLRRLYRILGITSGMSLSALALTCTLLPDEALRGNWPLFAIVFIQMFVRWISIALWLWYQQKLAELAGDGLTGKIFAFYKWLAAFFIAIAVLSLPLYPKTLLIMAARLLVSGFGLKYDYFKESYPGGYSFLILTMGVVFLCWPIWQLYRRIRVPATEVFNEYE